MLLKRALQRQYQKKISSKNSVNHVKVKGKSFYLNQKYDEEVEVSHSPELLKHILGDEVPKRVLETRDSQHFINTDSVASQISKMT